MQNQNQKALSKPPESRTDQLEVRKVVEPPPISETVQRVAQSLKMARRHVCRECNKPPCKHFQRIDLDTGEQFDITDDPSYIDADLK
jgi:hypothetical protein